MATIFQIQTQITKNKLNQKAKKEKIVKFIIFTLCVTIECMKSVIKIDGTPIKPIDNVQSWFGSYGCPAVSTTRLQYLGSDGD